MPVDTTIPGTTTPAVDGSPKPNHGGGVECDASGHGTKVRIPTTVGPGPGDNLESFQGRDSIPVTADPVPIIRAETTVPASTERDAVTLLTDGETLPCADPIFVADDLISLIAAVLETVPATEGHLTVSTPASIEDVKLFQIGVVTVGQALDLAAFPPIRTISFVATAFEGDGRTDIHPLYSSSLGDTEEGIRRHPVLVASDAMRTMVMTVSHVLAPFESNLTIASLMHFKPFPTTDGVAVTDDAVRLVGTISAGQGTFQTNEATPSVCYFKPSLPTHA
jgi:hypothetical protein